MKIKPTIIIVLILVINIMFTNINIVQASNISDIIKGGDKFIDSAENNVSVLNETNLQDTSNILYGILLVLGISVAVLFASIMGIKFMIGSAEEKAQIKDALVPFIIGCIVVFGAFGLWKIFITIGNDL